MRDHSAIKNIAVFTDGEVLGDDIIKLGFIGALKKAFPAAKLTWICSDKTVYQTILADFAKDLIDEFLFLQMPKVKIKTLLEKKRLFPDSHFDMVIDSQHKLKRALWLKRSISHNIFISGAGSYVLSDHRPPLFRQKPAHMLGQVMALCTVAYGEDCTPEKMAVADEWHALAQSIIPDAPEGYIGYFPGASLDKKRWPLEAFIALAKMQTEKSVIFLGPAESALEPLLKEALPCALFPLSAAPPKTNHPAFTIACAARMRAIVANDSGGGHLAAASNVPMVSLIRSPSVRRKFLPVTSRVIGLTPQDFGGEVMADIPLDAVHEGLKGLLKK
jgi:ADP-heptose:LPS heptosyltransferase